MGSASDILKYLGIYESVSVIYKRQDPVSLRIVSQINLSVGSNGMPFIDVPCHHIPFVKRELQSRTVDNLIVIAVYYKIKVSDPGYLCWNTECCRKIMHRFIG